MNAVAGPSPIVPRPNTGEPTPPARGSGLEFTGLEKNFGDIRALDGASFTVERGEIFGFVGSNGAGKTTAMRIALGVLAADAGTVTLDGQPVDARIRRRIGYMPEERGLYPRDTVANQLIYLARLHGLDSARARAAMEHWTARLGVEQRRGDNLEQLSLGNQQRVQLAAALVHDPEVLILDEPFSGLDPVAADVMSEVLRERAHAGVACLFSSHQLDLVQRICDRVGIISRGQIIAQGTVAGLRDTGLATWIAGFSGPGAPAAAREFKAAATSLPVEFTSDGDAGQTGEAWVRARATGTDTPAQATRQELLNLALRSGAMIEFRQERPDLAEIFRSAVVVENSGPENEESGEKAGKRGWFGRR